MAGDLGRPSCLVVFAPQYSWESYPRRMWWIMGTKFQLIWILPLLLFQFYLHVNINIEIPCDVDNCPWGQLEGVLSSQVSLKINLWFWLPEDRRTHIFHYCPPPWRSHWGAGHTNAGHPSVRLSVHCKACWHDNFRFHLPIYTIFDPVMHTTIALDEFQHEWPWPTIDLLFQTFDLLFHIWPTVHNYTCIPKYLGWWGTLDPSGQLV